MLKAHCVAVSLLTLLLGSGCTPHVKISDDPNEKFTAQQTTINSFENSNTFNNYGFSYHYESRSGNGKTYFYKSIQEFSDNDFTNQRNILAETWVEIEKEEYLQTQQHYDQTGKIVDLHPEILQATPIYQKFLQFLEQQQARHAQFEKERTEFDKAFKHRQAKFDAEFNKNWDSTNKLDTVLTEPDPVQHSELDDVQMVTPDTTNNL